MATAFICPSGHTWRAAPAAAGACPVCGADGRPLPDTTAPGEGLSPPAGSPPVAPGYEVLSELGRGGMGVVYLARQTALRRLVALKTLRAGDHADGVALRRFQTEAEAVASLHHPGIVQIYERGESGGQPWFALEYVPGGTLADWLDGRPQRPLHAAALVAWLARAIEHAHGRGVIHRDLKPANVLLAGEGAAGEGDTAERGLFPSSSTTPAPTACRFVPKITDFGLARRVDEAGATLSGMVLGTPGFMAPEQAQGDPPGPAVDVHALGAVLYTALTGRPPYLAGSLRQTLLETIKAEPLPPARLVPGVPRDLDTVCLKCLARDPGQRYASAADLAADLDRFLRGVPVRARPAGPVERGWKWVRRRPLPAAFLAFVALAVVGFSATVVSYNRSLARQRDRVGELYDEAEAAHGEEKRLRREAEGRLLRQYLARSTRLLEEGDPLAALAYQVEALALESRDPGRGAAHRFRIGATLAGCPRLVGLWRHAGPAHDAAWSADGRRVFVAHGGGVHAHDAAAPGEGRALPHPRPVERLALRPDGRRLATADADGVVRLWDVASGREVGTRTRHRGRVVRLAFSPDGRRLLSAGEDRECVVRRDASSLTLKSPSEILYAGFSPDGRLVVTGGADGKARVWSADGGAPVAGPLGHRYPVRHAVFSADGKRLFTAAGSFNPAGSLGEVTAWTLAGGAAAPRVFPRARPVRRLALSADGKQLASAQHNGQVVLWDVASGEPTAVGLHEGPVEGVSFSPDDRRLLSASRDGTAAVWEVRNGALVRVGPPLWHAGPVRKALFRGDGGQVLTAGEDGVVRLWGLAPLAPGAGAFGPLLSQARFGPEGRRVLTAAYDGKARVWDATTGSPRTPWLRHGRRVERALFSPDGRHALTAGTDGGVRLWDAETGGLVWLRAAHRGAVRDAAFRDDGRRVATGGDDGLVRLWRARDGAPVGAPFRAGGRVRQVAFTANGARLFALNSLGEARLFPAAEPGRRGEGLGGGVEVAGASPDGRWVATADAAGATRLWRTDPPQAVGPPLDCRPGLSLLAFDRAGGRLATLSVDRVARVREVPSGRTVGGPMRNADAEWGNQNLLQSAAFTAAGGLLAVGTSGGQVRLWEVETGELAAPPLRLPYPATTSVAFDPSGRRLAAAAWSPAGGGVCVVREVEPSPLPVVDLRRLAGVLGGRRVGADGRLEPVPAGRLERDWGLLRDGPGDRLQVTAEEERLWRVWEVESALQGAQTRGVAGGIDRLAEEDPAGWRPAFLRGRLFGVEGRPREAAEAFALARARGAEDERLWLWEGYARLVSGDHPGYRKVCAGAVARYGGTRVPETAGDVARLCLCRPDALADFRPVVTLARLEHDHAPEETQGRATLGGALLLAGRGAEAVAPLEAAAGAGSLRGRVFLALAHARAGRAGEARELLAGCKEKVAGRPDLAAVFSEADRTIPARPK